MLYTLKDSSQHWIHLLELTILFVAISPWCHSKNHIIKWSAAERHLVSPRLLSCAICSKYFIEATRWGLLQIYVLEFFGEHLFALMHFNLTIFVSHISIEISVTPEGLPTIFQWENFGGLRLPAKCGDLNQIWVPSLFSWMDVPVVPLSLGEHETQIFFPNKGLAPAQISGSSSRDVAKMLRDRQIMLPGVTIVVTFPVLLDDNGVFKSAVILFHRHKTFSSSGCSEMYCICRVSWAIDESLYLNLDWNKHHITQICAGRIVFKEALFSFDSLLFPLKSYGSLHNTIHQKTWSCTAMYHAEVQGI